MNHADTPLTADGSIETVLREELAQGESALDTVGPILRHLITNHDQSLFSDEIVARVRGMVEGIARQLLEFEAEAAGEPAPYTHAQRHGSDLAAQLAGHLDLLSHCHALAVEYQLAERLRRAAGLDPVLSPLMQSLIGSDDPATAALAMQALASQARFMQQQKRMSVPLGELPADIFDRALRDWRRCASLLGGPQAAALDKRMRHDFDESRARSAQLARLVAGMGSGARASLAVTHAGVALFLTALASVSQQPRDVVAISTSHRQLPRLALALRSAGLAPGDVEKQLLQFDPDATVPQGFAGLGVDRAQAMLAALGSGRIG